MSRRTVFLIAAGVIAVHAILFYLIAGMSPLPKVPYIPPDNFSLGWAKFQDKKSHENMIYEEFTVSTSIGPPAASPAPPARSHE